MSKRPKRRIVAASVREGARAADTVTAGVAFSNAASRMYLSWARLAIGARSSSASLGPTMLIGWAQFYEVIG